SLNAGGTLANHDIKRSNCAAERGADSAAHCPYLVAGPRLSPAAAREHSGGLGNWRVPAWSSAAPEDRRGPNAEQALGATVICSKGFPRSRLSGFQNARLHR